MKVELVRAATRELYRRGELDFKRNAGQLKIKKAVEASASTSRKFFVLCSRRFGKSYERCLHGVELCLRKPGARVLFLAPFASNAAEIATDLMGQLLIDCPKELQPTYLAQTKEFVWRRPGLPDSVMRLRGVNGEHAQYLRGTSADLIIIDEGGIVDDLKSLINDVALPMTLTTNGKIIIATTPPKTPGHYSAQLYEELSGAGAYVKLTLRDADHISYAVKCEMLREVGENPERIAGILAGELEPETTTAKREFFCEFVTDESSAVVPEFNLAAQREIVRETVRPDYFDAYVGMDPGMRDRSGLLFGHVDFLNGTVVIEDEALLPRNQSSTGGIAKCIKDKERGLWGDFKEPFLRVSDVDLRLQADLLTLHKLRFISADKRNSIGAINVMRDLVRERRLVIHPRCVNLIRQLRNAIWNRKATDFDRPGGNSEESIDGHFDLVAALKYMVRHINWKRNPYPENYYARGGLFGPKHGEWVSPKRHKTKRDIFDKTPTGRRMAGAAKSKKRG